MRKNKWFYLLFLSGTVLLGSACKKQLNVGNPNLPTVGANASNEPGIIALSIGAVYINGFQNGDVWLGDSYFSLPYGYSELLGDAVGADAANQLISQLTVPDYWILDDGTKVPNKGSNQRSVLRANNNRAATGAGNNPPYYQWLNMYAMNAALNLVLANVDIVKFGGDAATRANTIKAWCYWWKGYAYASIGSMYYSGLINDVSGSVTSKYLIKDSIIDRSNYYLNQAATILSGITNAGDFTTVLGELIPAFCQVGNGGVLTPTMWIHNINTMLARNILVNKLAPFVNGNPAATITGASNGNMTAADWTSVLTLATNGIQSTDFIFTGRSTPTNGFFGNNGGTVSAMTTGPNSGTTFKISERFIQEFKPGDKRLANDFDTSKIYNSGGTFSTRYNLVSDGLGGNTYIYGSKTTGAYELFIAGSYEENELMLAEANIRSGNIDAGLAFVDAERAYQGAGVAAVSGSSLDLAGAMEELTRERRVALAFRGLSFYDSRRWGWIYDISKGGGFYGATILYNGVLNTHATIDYNFLDYWDVPADEFILNPPAEGSAAIVNPN